MPAQAFQSQNDPGARQSLRERFRQVRATSEALCAPLAIEDYGIQGMPDASPPKWHLAHTTWFFEAFLLLPFHPRYRTPDSRYDGLFNSYYLTHGHHKARKQGFPFSINDFCLTRLKGGDLLIWANCQHFSRCQGDSLGPWTGGIHRQNLGVFDDKFSFHSIPP